MILINIIGFALILLIIWWFWLYRPREASAQDAGLVIILEHGSYSPAHIKLPAGQAITLTFLRKDESPCAEFLVIPALDISQALPVNKPATINLPALQPGDYPFHCQMQMYRGELHVT